MGDTRSYSAISKDNETDFAVPVVDLQRECVAVNPQAGLLGYFPLDIAPPEVIHRILSYVPAKDLITSAMRVCKCWNELLSDRHFWYTKLKCQGIVLSDDTRSKMMRIEDPSKELKILQRMCSSHISLNKNLIKNSTGKDGLKCWKIRHGGDGLRVESPPCGSNQIPDYVGVDTQSCFATSYDWCSREQVVHLKEFGFSPMIMDLLHPDIMISEWVSARYDCRSQSKLNIILYGKDSQSAIDLEWSSDDEEVMHSEWYEVKKRITDYPEGLHSIGYRSMGKDLQFWAGHYGAKSTGSSVIVAL